MPIIKSAKKRVRTAEKAAIRNSKTKRSLKTALKSFHKAITGGEKEVTEVYSKAQSALDTAAKKGLMHKNKVARQKSQLAAAAKKAAATTATKAKPAVKKTTTAAKKATTAAKTTATKATKAATKPATTRKPAAKKATTK